MDEERLQILKMLEEGKISSEEAAALLEAIEASAKGPTGADEPGGRAPRGDAGAGEGCGDAGRRRWRGDWPGFDHAGFDRGMEDFRREMERIRLRAIDIGDEVSRRVRETAREHGGTWRHGGPRPFRQFIRDFGDVFNLPYGREMHEEDFEREVPAGPAPEVEIRDLSGDVTVEAWDRDVVGVKATKRVWAGSREEAAKRASDYEVSVEQRDGGVFIEARLAPDAPGWLPARCTIDYKVRVPATAKLRVLLTNGDVQVTGVRGGVELRSTNGEVVAASIAGNIRATSTNGSITLRAVQAETIEVKTVNGDVDLDLEALGQGDHFINTARGDISLKLPAGARLDLLASTMHGEISCRVPVAVVSQSSTRLEARVGAAADKAAGAAEAAGVAETAGVAEPVSGLPGLEIRALFGDIEVLPREEDDDR
jgi:hypothetical protein